MVCQASSNLDEPQKEALRRFAAGRAHPTHTSSQTLDEIKQSTNVTMIRNKINREQAEDSQLIAYLRVRQAIDEGKHVEAKTLSTLLTEFSDIKNNIYKLLLDNAFSADATTKKELLKDLITQCEYEAVSIITQLEEKERNPPRFYKKYPELTALVAGFVISAGVILLFVSKNAKSH